MKKDADDQISSVFSIKLTHFNNSSYNSNVHFLCSLYLDLKTTKRNFLCTLREFTNKFGQI